MRLLQVLHTSYVLLALLVVAAVPAKTTNKPPISIRALMRVIIWHTLLLLPQRGPKFFRRICSQDFGVQTFCPGVKSYLQMTRIRCFNGCALLPCCSYAASTQLDK